MDDKLRSITCPHCGGTLELQNDLDTFFCLYCGGKVVLTELSDAAYDARVKIKEMEHQERLQDKEYEFQKYKNKDKNKYFVLFFAVSIGLLMLSISMMLLPSMKHNKKVKHLQQIENEVEQAIINENYDLAIIKANQLHCDDGWSKEEHDSWDEKREFYIQLINSKQNSHNAPQPN